VALTGKPRSGCRTCRPTADHHHVPAHHHSTTSASRNGRWVCTRPW
jgi:hypothetical protein